jgi:hypothetical protein
VKLEAPANLFNYPNGRDLIGFTIAEPETTLHAPPSQLQSPHVRASDPEHTRKPTPIRDRRKPDAIPPFQHHRPAHVLTLDAQGEGFQLDAAAPRNATGSPMIHDPPTQTATHKPT